MNSTIHNSTPKNILKYGLFPALFYLSTFCVLTWPLITDFNTRFLTDAGDGMQNVWNIWWINTAVTQPGTHPTIWHTDMLHWPFGSTLYAHTLNSFNGYLAILLLRHASLVQTFNFLVIFAFVMSGVSAYWLAYYLSRSFAGSLVGGCIFTFSSYHFAHYHGHLNLISLEFIPIFVLSWHVFIKRPRLITGIISALSLYLVLLCDYYYFFYCILTGSLMFFWHLFKTRNLRRFFQRDYLISFSLFLFFTLFTTGQIIFPVIYLSRIDSFMGGHKPENFSLDLLGLFIPGEAWKFHAWTEAYWSKLPLGVSEANVYLGYAVIILLIFLWTKRRKLTFADSSKVTFWYLILGFFFIMALGPALQIHGKIIYNGIMPYTILEAILPFLKLSGVPIRMVVMVTLAASILCALSVRELLVGGIQNVFFVFALLVLLIFETLSSSLPTTPTNVPEYVYALEKLPNNGGVLDLAAPTRYLHLYYQTVHHEPLVFGYISRIPISVAKKEIELDRAIKRQDYVKLWDTYHIRYIATKNVIEYESPFMSVELVYQDGETNIYRLGLRRE